MEVSLSFLSYKGSVAQAISEAKQLKKLFVVYISDDGLESKRLENVTWIDPTVREALSKYCILLHVVKGSSEAQSFSEIYPMQSVPCITAVGYNGIKLWQREGFVTADVLASSFEKAWLSLHFQETTAAFLSAALASGNQFGGETSTHSSLSGQLILEEQSSMNDHAQSAHSQTIDDDNNFEEPYKEKDTESKQETFVDSSKPSPADVLNEDADPVSSAVPTLPSITHEVSESTKAATILADDLKDDSVEVRNEVSETITRASAFSNREETVEAERSDDTSSTAAKSTIVFLNIRLPDGSSLQVQFSVDDTLRMVKDYIIENSGSPDSFSIAIPYPRKVFDNQDLDASLLELGFFDRQALVVVPQKKSSHSGGGSSSQVERYSTSDTDDSWIANEGYWASLRKILSYVNPFSYLPRNSSSQNDPQSISQYRPNPSSRYTGGDESTFRPFDTSDTSADSSRNRSRRPPSSGFGANIHTLKHDEDDDRFNDRNAFWNGNSTQFGGNDDGR